MPIISYIYFVIFIFINVIKNVFSVKLNYVSYPADATAFQDKSPLVIIHGLFGHHGNWNSVAKAIQGKLQQKVIVTDLRNHGDSQHVSSMHIEEMAADIEHMIPEWAPKAKKCILLAHSLGGKVASYLALDKPHLLEKLILEDIVPKSYSMSRYVDMVQFVRTMRKCTWQSSSLSDIRKEVDKQLAPAVSDLATRQFLLTNLVERNGKIMWRLNLDTIEKFIPLMFGFPESVQNKQYPGSTLVVWGEKTIHLDPTVDEPYLRKLFPSMTMQMIPGAGHWIHAQKPKEFIETVVGFLS